MNRRKFIKGLMRVGSAGIIVSAAPTIFLPPLPKQRRGLVGTWSIESIQTLESLYGMDVQLGVSKRGLGLR
mgnify:CR=1 FL=1